jgi:protein phosphatase
MTTVSLPVQGTWAVETDPGRTREINEDRSLVRPPVFAVADGLGGRNAGEVAAQLAVASLADALGGRTGARALVDAFQRVNEQIVGSAAASPSARGMSTTLAVLQLDGSRAHVAHVGDSRVYLLRRRRLERLTEDHTVVAQLVRAGTLTDAEAAVHERRHVLTQALGAVPMLDVTTTEVEVEPGDRFLLCTDGLSGQVDDGTIEAALVENGHPALAARRLVELANGAGGVDNVTVVVVDASELEPARIELHPNPSPVRRTTRAAPALLAAILGGLLLAGLAIGWAVGRPSGEPVASSIPSAAPSEVPVAGPSSFPSPVALPSGPAEGVPSAAASAPAAPKTQAP